jgi:hypothetical protein
MLTGKHGFLLISLTLLLCPFRTKCFLQTLWQYSSILTYPTCIITISQTKKEKKEQSELLINISKGKSIEYIRNLNRISYIKFNGRE